MPQIKDLYATALSFECQANDNEEPKKQWGNNGEETDLQLDTD
jgi:hypothetical protein